MRKTTKLFLGFTAGLLLLCGCSAAEEKYYIIFLDADLNEKPYYASEDGHTIYTEGGTVIGSAKKEMDWSGSQCNLYVNLEDNGTQVMDFQDKYALLDMMYDEANEYYKDNK